ncbi:MAG: aldo/keto reductase, partial [Planctomycetes bacterium]|nr:aldo/keto reductase [Planctomycetota bacterium]
MRYRRFGRTGLSMPVFSCGGMRYQHKWQDCREEEIPGENQGNLEAIVERAFELGINHFETARGYGTSEMQLGRILPHLPREEIIVQTKVGPEKKVKDFLVNVEKSMGYLKLDRVDLFALHGVNNEERLENCLRPGGCLEAAQQLRDEGVFDYLGFSTHGPLDLILKAIETDAFDYINLHWYYIFQVNWRAIEAAAARDMGVFIISPSDKGGMLYNPSQRLVELCQPLSPMVFNDLFCLSRPEVTTLSLGAAKPGDFDEHLKVLDFLDQAQEVAGPIARRLDEVMADRLGADWVEHFRDGLPGPEETPGNLNIPILLWMRNLVLAYDMVGYAKMRYGLFNEGGHWFPGDKIESLEALRAM